MHGVHMWGCSAHTRLEFRAPCDLGGTGGNGGTGSDGRGCGTVRGGEGAHARGTVAAVRFGGGKGGGSGGGGDAARSGGGKVGGSGGGKVGGSGGGGDASSFGVSLSLTTRVTSSVASRAVVTLTDETGSAPPSSSSSPHCLPPALPDHNTNAAQTWQQDLTYRADSVFGS